MKKLKKLACILCSGGLTAISIIGTTTFATTNLSYQISDDAIINSNKSEPYMPTHCMYSYNKSESSRSNCNVSVYDLYAKIDTETFPDSYYDKLTYQSYQKITSVDCRLDNGDGSYIIPRITGFQPAQMCHYKVYFPKNGDYKCSVNASTGINGTYTLHVTEVNSFSSSSDQIPPNLSYTYTPPVSYADVPVIINISSDELCTMTVDGKTYKECNKVEFPVYSNGQYPIIATDRNGNKKTDKFVVDFIPAEKPPETTKVPATTTKKTTTTTKPQVTTTPINVNLFSGDANMDGRISIADATAILQSLGNPDKYKLSTSGAINADCYKPGSGVTANDALAIRMLDAQMIDSLPVLS